MKELVYIKTTLLRTGLTSGIEAKWKSQGFSYFNTIELLEAPRESRDQAFY